MRTLKIYCKNLDRYIDASGGDTLLDIYFRISAQLPFTPICARVNNKTEDLNFPVYAPKVVEFLPITSDSGQRCYIRSLCMVLYKAVHDLMPGVTLRIEHSISRGYYCRLIDFEPDEADVERIRAHMAAIIRSDMRFERHEMLTKDVIDIFRSQGLEDKVTLLSTRHELYLVVTHAHQHAVFVWC